MLPKLVLCVVALFNSADADCEYNFLLFWNVNITAVVQV